MDFRFKPCLIKNVTQSCLQIWAPETLASTNLSNPILQHVRLYPYFVGLLPKPEHEYLDFDVPSVVAGVVITALLELGVGGLLVCLVWCAVNRVKYGCWFVRSELGRDEEAALLEGGEEVVVGKVVTKVGGDVGGGEILSWAEKEKEVLVARANGYRGAAAGLVRRTGSLVIGAEEVFAVQTASL